MPASTAASARRARGRLRLVIARRPVRWGSLRRFRPLGTDWGTSRGTPIDRYYIERFIDGNRAGIGGRVLEVKEDLYASRYGDAVTAVDILDVDPTNDRVTILADLGARGALPPNRFDCVIVTQTLQFVGDLDIAVTNLWSSLTPGGTMLLSVPCISRLERTLADVERWRFLPNGLAAQLHRLCPGATVVVEGHGNQLAATAFLSGLATRDLRARELDHDDPLCPLVVTALVQKPRRASVPV